METDIRKKNSVQKLQTLIFRVNEEDYNDLKIGDMVNWRNFTRIGSGNALGFFIKKNLIGRVEFIVNTYRRTYELHYIVIILFSGRKIILRKN